MKKLIAYRNYFGDFLEKLTTQERVKILQSLDLLSTSDMIPAHYIKYIRNGVYEFRITYMRVEYRIFFFYDGDTIVVLLNSFKKSRKTPEDEISKAIKLKEDYYEAKGNQ